MRGRVFLTSEFLKEGKATCIVVGRGGCLSPQRESHVFSGGEWGGDDTVWGILCCMTTL